MQARHYWNGEIVAAWDANNWLEDCAAEQGIPNEDIEIIWANRLHCEESRELIFEFSRYQLEIVIVG